MYAEFLLKTPEYTTVEVFRFGVSVKQAVVADCRGDCAGAGVAADELESVLSGAKILDGSGDVAHAGGIGMRAILH